jgi:hypothetical protein
VSDFGMLDLERALMLAAVAAAVLAVIILKLSGGVRSPAALLLPLIFACTYGYGAVVLGNAELDAAAGEMYRVRVLAMHVSRSSKSVTYHLTLDAWGPRSVPSDVTVPGDLYRELAPGGAVCVHRGPGALGIAWFKVNLCGA